MSSFENGQSSSNHVSDEKSGVYVNGEPVSLTDRTPTGRQVIAAADLRPDTEFALLLWPETGPTREIGLEEVTRIPKNGSAIEFLAIRADHVSYFVFDDDRYAWAGPLDLETIRRICRVPSNRTVWLELRDEPDRELEHGESVDLSGAGVERFYTRERKWRLDVQGEPTEWDHPDVIVRDALVRAGFDTSQKCVIVLKMKGKPHSAVELDDVIDLDQPGIERLWLRPKEVNNGDGQSPRRDFSLLPKDEDFFTASNYCWETIAEGGRRWLIIENYAVPRGYNVPSCRLALEIPRSYPSAQIDMFYCDPPLSHENGKAPPATDGRKTIVGVSFQRWSRHRNAANRWSPTRDNVATHLGLVDEALGREIEA
ncbi:multiubiquitin domain-containing protein [Endozoicomonas sp. G2_2]|uniref:multiubiquitin domain-containing protein n=1 Tax=Endozoicomonas sp. G2_2 TaxID=2821092 RepID=UPI001ADC6E13|nr:multiubiquitin domain-containing protein [Endozoicomonas sp. G2_2]MBO9471791.1 multiubiquitin domain-containing protein [Endozoicomonas sp. G2_2]